MLSAVEASELAEKVAQHRDRAAFARLFDHFAPRLQSYLLRSGMDAGTAEDIVQDTLSVLWHKAALFDTTKSSLTTWLYRIARNRRIDLQRRRRDHAVVIDEAFDIADTARLPDANLQASQQEALLRQALTSLPDEQMHLVRLGFFDGLSHSEIAERTGLPLGTVKSRFRLALARLRKVLEANGLQADSPST